MRKTHLGELSFFSKFRWKREGGQTHGQVHGRHLILFHRVYRVVKEAQQRLQHLPARRPAAGRPPALPAAAAHVGTSMKKWCQAVRGPATERGQQGRGRVRYLPAEHAWGSLSSIVTMRTARGTEKSLLRNQRRNPRPRLTPELTVLTTRLDWQGSTLCWLFILTCLLPRLFQTSCPSPPFPSW